MHGDAYPGNTLWDGESVRLGDWDEAATGPRELDLANTHQGARFGRTPAAIDAFTSAYGHSPWRLAGTFRPDLDARPSHPSHRYGRSHPSLQHPRR
ncbi:phosphotransferase family protein [Streptomyces roseoverticillatus]|uniref:Phosphotransferase n=1 Tax=Streptomyces roseoverticillatus TaxID=66429 RepID=A0ABV3J5C3_9ACTN